MSISIPNTVSATFVSEYAATSTIINRSMVLGTDGFLSPAFTATINYARKDYVVDASGNKTGIIIKQDSGMAMAPINPGTDPTLGFLMIDAATLLPYFGQAPEAGKVVGECLADLIDSLIRADLVKRGILQS